MDILKLIFTSGSVNILLSNALDFVSGIIYILFDGIAYNMCIYYSTIMSFYHIRSRERAKYEAVIHRSVLV